MNIVVLCGGTSSERNVSLSSSRMIAKALLANGHAVCLLDVFFGSVGEASFSTAFDVDKEYGRLLKLSDSVESELATGRPFMTDAVLNVCRQADCVFMGLHGANGEDGKLQAMFDLMGIKYTGSDSTGSAICMSKTYTKDVLSSHIRMPKGITIFKNECFELNADGSLTDELTDGAKVYEKLGFPCVVKPNNGGSSVGVTIAQDATEYRQALQAAFKWDDTVLVEEYVKGRELTQGVLMGKALPPVEIIPKQGFYDYENKYVDGMTDHICPADIPAEALAEMSAASVNAGRLLKLKTYFRLDYLLKDDGSLYCLEVNTLPGMTPTSLVPHEAETIGISFNELCELIVRDAIG